MDGLECSEVLLSQLERTNRIDAEFYKKRSLYIAEMLKSMNAESLTTYVDVSDGNHMGISDKFTDVGIPYYRGQDIHNFFIEDGNPICIDEDTFNDSYMLRSHLRKDDILLSIVGTIGEVSLVTKDDKATCNCKLAILRPHDPRMAALIAIYLKTKYGFDQVDKLKRGAVQMGYLLEDMNQIFIPRFSAAISNAIKAAVTEIKSLTERSIKQYQEAETLLLNEIGVDMSYVKDGGVSVKSFSESFGQSGRLDAEYYQPKYDQFYKQIINYKGGHTTPRKEFYLVKTKCDQTLPEYPYVEIGDIDTGTGTSEYHYIDTKDLPANAKIMTRKGDIVISTVRPYRGAVSILTENNLLVSGAFTVLRKHSDYPAQTLQVLLRTALYKEWLLKFNVGTSYPVIKDDDVLDIPIPILQDSIHSEIKEKVDRSHILLQKSKQLLECAKQAVEMAIEKSEAAAMTWLDEKI